MEIKLNEKETFGNDLRFYGARLWSDFNTKSILGSKIEIVCIEKKYERILVKMPLPLEYLKDIKENTRILLENVSYTPYIRNGFIQHSFKADNISLVEEEE